MVQVQVDAILISSLIRIAVLSVYMYTFGWYLLGFKIDLSHARLVPFIGFKIDLSHAQIGTSYVFQLGNFPTSIPAPKS